MKISFSKQTKERAFKQLYEEYYAPFCLYAKRFVDDKETREEILRRKLQFTKQNRIVYILLMNYTECCMKHWTNFRKTIVQYL